MQRGQIIGLQGGAFCAIARVFGSNGGERDSLFHQPFDTGAAVLHHMADHIAVAQPRTGIQRIGDVGLDAVFVIEDGGDTTLGPEGGTLAQLALADNGDPGEVGALQCQCQTRSTAADDQYVVVVNRCGIVDAHCCAVT